MHEGSFRKCREASDLKLFRWILRRYPELLEKDVAANFPYRPPKTFEHLLFIELELPKLGNTKITPIYAKYAKRSLQAFTWLLENKKLEQDDTDKIRRTSDPRIETKLQEWEEENDW